MTTEPISRSSIGLRSERGPILIAVMLTTGLVAIDATILATAVPAVVEDLGGFAQFPWLFSVYLLAQAVSVPLYGKFADMVGRKPMILLGIGLFLLGSVLCGFAWSMVSLIVFRAVQGLGAGAVLPMGMTIIGDIYTVAERAKVQGYVASVWATASVVGPTLGGVFSDYMSWRWIFFVNIPIAIAAALMLRGFSENVTHTPHRVDFAGALLLATGGTLLILGLLKGGVAWAWDSATSVAVLGSSVVLIAAFILVERVAKEPILPLWIFRQRVLVGVYGTGLLIGVITMGLTSYVPLYSQGVLGTNALVAGFVLAALTIGWPLSSAFSGRIYLRFGFRDTGFLGTAFVVGGAGILLLVEEQRSIWLLVMACFVIGIGMGLVAAPLTVAAQSSVDWSSRGVVTATNMFSRSVGSAVGVAIFGAVANAAVARRLGGDHPDLEHLSVDVLAPAIHEVYIGVAIAALVAVAAIAVMPRRTDIVE